MMNTQPWTLAAVQAQGLDTTDTGVRAPSREAKGDMEVKEQTGNM